MLPRAAFLTLLTQSGLRDTHVKPRERQILSLNVHSIRPREMVLTSPTTASSAEDFLVRPFLGAPRLFPEGDFYLTQIFRTTKEKAYRSLVEERA